MPRTARVEAFLRSGKVVCPYARTAALLLPEAPRDPSAFERREVAKQAAKFVRKTAKIALVLVGPDLKDFASSKAWAIDWFLELAVVFAVLSGEPPVVARRRVETDMRPCLVEEPMPARPLLSCRGETLPCIAMIPLYEAGDPRFSPIPILVVTRGRQVLEVPSASRDMIRARTKARKGDYDADELILPIGAPEPVNRDLVRFCF